MSNLAPLADLQFAHRPQPATEIGERGRLDWIALSDLYIDSSYQREILDNGKTNIRRMIEEFEWALFGVLIVSVRDDGRYAIIDGQHRATAAKYLGTIKKTLDNVALVCWRCNNIKRNYAANDLRVVASWIERRSLDKFESAA